MRHPRSSKLIMKHRQGAWRSKNAYVVCYASTAPIQPTRDVRSHQKEPTDVAVKCESAEFDDQNVSLASDMT